MKLRLLSMLLLAATGYASVLTISFDNLQLSGAPGGSLLFTGSLVNTSADTVYLTSAELTLDDIGLSGDATPFFLNSPLSLNSAEDTGSIGLFTVAIANPFLSGPGIYGGLFTVLSGTEFGGQEFSDSVAFQVAIPTPEPASGWLTVAALAIFLYGISRRNLFADVQYKKE